MKIYHHLVTRIARNTASAENIEWMRRRTAFFRRYSLASIRAQTVHPDLIWIQTTDAVRHVLEQELGSIQDIVITSGDHRAELLPLIPPCDLIYSTRLDSDDVYNRNALKITRKSRMSKKRIECLMFTRGYVHDVHSGRWGVYYSRSSPFFTLTIPYNLYMNDKAISSLELRHGRVRDIYPTRILSPWHFCALRHGGNTQTDEILRKRGLNPDALTPRHHPYRNRKIEDFIESE